MKVQRYQLSARVLLAILVLVGLTMPLLQFKKASAVPFTAAYVRLNTLLAVTATGGRVCATPSATNLAQTEGRVVINFPNTVATNFALNATLGNWNTNTTFESGFAGVAWPGIGTATNITGQAVTFPSGDLTNSSTLYCFNFGTVTPPLTNSSAGAAYTGANPFAYIETQTAAAAQIDKDFWGVTIISADSTVTVGAVVAPFFTLTLDANSDNFTANLSSTAVINTTGRTLTVNTNALGGWILWARGLNSKTVSDTGSTNLHGALTSITAGGYAISNNTVNALATPSASHNLASCLPASCTAEDYGLAVSAITDAGGGGTVTANAAYVGTTANFAGVIDPTQFRPIGSANGTAAGDILTIQMRALILNTTPPGNDYTDTIRYVGAGQF